MGFSLCRYARGQTPSACAICERNDGRSTLFNTTVSTFCWYASCQLLSPERRLVARNSFRGDTWRHPLFFVSAFQGHHGTLGAPATRPRYPTAVSQTVTRRGYTGQSEFANVCSLPPSTLLVLPFSILGCAPISLALNSVLICQRFPDALGRVQGTLLPRQVVRRPRPLVNIDIDPRSCLGSKTRYERTSCDPGPLVLCIFRANFLRRFP